MRRPSKSLILAALIIIGLATYIVYKNGPEGSAEIPNLVLLAEPKSLSYGMLRTTDGRPFNQDVLKGRWSFLFFGFTSCPDICPVTMSVMGEADRSLGMNTFQGIMVSVDPERDTQERLEKYVKAFSENFLGVIGAPLETRTFSGSLGIAQAKMYSSKEDYTVNHSGHIVVINPNAEHVGYIAKPQSADLIADVFKGLAR